MAQLFSRERSVSRIDPHVAPILRFISSASVAAILSSKIRQAYPFHKFCGQLVGSPVYAAFLEQDRPCSCRCSNIRRDFLHDVKELTSICEARYPSFVGAIRAPFFSPCIEAIFDPQS